MNMRLAGPLATVAIAAALVVGIATPSFASTQKSGAGLNCGATETVRIGWSTSGTGGSRPYYTDSSGSSVVGNYYSGSPNTWNTGKRLIAGWTVIANGTLGTVTVYCAS